MSHISPLCCRGTPSSLSLRSISVVVCLPKGSNLLQRYVQCVLMKQKKEQHAVSHTHLPKRYKSLLAVKCMPVLCTVSRGREGKEEREKNWGRWWAELWEKERKWGKWGWKPDEDDRSGCQMEETSLSTFRWLKVIPYPSICNEHYCLTATHTTVDCSVGSTFISLVLALRPGQHSMNTPVQLKHFWLHKVKVFQAFISFIAHKRFNNSLCSFLTVFKWRGFTCPSKMLQYLIHTVSIIWTVGSKRERSSEETEKKELLPLKVLFACWHLKTG